MSNTNSSYSGSDFGSQYGLPNPAFIDWSKVKKLGYDPFHNTLYPTTADGQTVVPTSNPYSQEIEAKLEYQRRSLPYEIALQQSAAKAAADSTTQQMVSNFPILSAGASQSKSLNEKLSEKYAQFKDYLPSSQTARTVAMTGAGATAAGGEANRDVATAAQWQAAGAVPRYAGQTFRMA